MSIANRKKKIAQAKSAAVHSDTLWGGPRLIENATAEPVLVETKTEYWDLLNKQGLRMKDQQESTTGPQVDPVVVPLVEAAIVVPPMSQDEAQVYGAITAVMKRHNFIETLWCDDCMRLNRSSGCRVRVFPREVSIECRCGKATYKPPMGTTDTVLKALANSTVKEREKTGGTVVTQHGTEFRPTVHLDKMEAILIQKYMSAVRWRHKEPRWFHRDCFNGNPRVEDEALAMSVTGTSVALVCRCQQWHYQSASKATIH